MPVEMVGPQLPGDFGARVRAARAYAGIASQAKLGKELGMSGGYVKLLEAGKRPDALKAQALLTRLPDITGLGEEFFLGRAAGGVAAELAEIRDSLEALRIETEARDLEVIRRLEEGLGPHAATR